MEIQNAKAQIRKEHLRIRNQMSVEEISALSGRIISNIKMAGAMLIKVHRDVKVYGYYPLGSEVSLIEFYYFLLKKGVPLAFPRVEGPGMDFYQVQSLGELEEGSFHVKEPKKSCQKVHWEDTICFTPGVVFDRNGARFGYGKGYYDRFYTRHPHILRVGAAYENQIEEKLPRDVWDMPMDYVITEQGIITKRQ